MIHHRNNIFKLLSPLLSTKYFLLINIVIVVLIFLKESLFILEIIPLSGMGLQLTQGLLLTLTLVFL